MEHETWNMKHTAYRRNSLRLQTRRQALQTKKENLASGNLLINNFLSLYTKFTTLGKKEFLKYLDKFSRERLRIRIEIENGKVIDIVVQYETLIAGKWKAIIRYDCDHGFFHRDVIFPDGTKEKQVIEFDSLETALTYAEQDLKDRWEFYKNRYLKKLKK